jgi:hypothetical protein
MFDCLCRAVKMRARNHVTDHGTIDPTALPLRLLVLHVVKLMVLRRTAFLSGIYRAGFARTMYPYNLA